MLGALCLAASAPPAAAHDPLGRAQPNVATTVEGSGLAWTIAFRVRDVDSGNPIPSAVLGVRAVDGGSTVGCDVTRVQVELFRCRLVFPRPGDWNVQVRVDGDQVVPTTFSVDVQAVGDSTAQGVSSGGTRVAPLVGLCLAGLAAAGALAAVVVLRRRR